MEILAGRFLEGDVIVVDKAEGGERSLKFKKK